MKYYKIENSIYILTPDNLYYTIDKYGEYAAVFQKKEKAKFEEMNKGYLISLNDLAKGIQKKAKSILKRR